MKRFIKIAIIFVLAILISFSSTVFATEDDPLILNGWGELVDTLAGLKDGEKLRVKINPQAGDDNVVPRYETAYIYANKVEITFVDTDFCTFPGEGEISVVFGVAADDVILNFEETYLCCGNCSVIEVDGNNCHINGGWFSGCKNLKGYGAAIYITNYDPGCRINGCTFKSCEAKYGGAIYIDSDDVRIEGCTFDECYASKEGLDVYDNNSDCVVSECSTSHPKNRNPFAYVREVEKTWYGGWYYASIFSQGSVLILAAVMAAAIVAVVVLIIVKKKRKLTMTEGTVNDSK